MVALLIIPLLVSGALSVIGAGAAWRRRARPAAAPLALVSLCAGFWALCNALELLSLDTTARLFWGSFKFVGITLLPVGTASFMMRFAGQRTWPTRQGRLAMLAAAGLTLLIIFTNPYHHLFWTGSALVQYPGYTTLVKTPGPFFVLHTLYSYGLIFTSTLVAFARISHLRQAYRREISLLAIGIYLPLLSTLLSLLGVQPFPGIDLSPVMFGLSALFLLLTTGLSSLLDVSPLAYTTLVEQMRDGVLVLDSQQRVLSLNLTAEKIIAAPRQGIVGKNLSSLAYPALQMLLPYWSGSTVEREVQLGSAPDTQWYELYISTVFADDKQAVGNIVMWHNISERKRIEAQLSYASNHDFLTGLYNRMYFEETLARIQLGRTWPTAAIAADMDNLKRINDQYGHSAGDSLICRAADLLRQELRSADLLARVGGDEFAILLPGCDTPHAQAIMQRIQVVIELYNRTHPPIPVEVSMGFAVANNGSQLDEALRQADQHMYQNKTRRKEARERAQRRD